MNKILGYRKMLKKTQSDMAKAFGISEQTYRNKEKERISFKKEEMVKFRNMLKDNGLTNISIEDIFFN